MMAGIVHIVDDEDAVRQMLATMAESEGHAAMTHPTAEAFLDTAVLSDAGCVVTDVRMPGMGGLELLSTLAARRQTVPVIVITGAGDVRMAVEAMRAGAANFLEKPFGAGEFIAAVDDALTRRAESLTMEAEIAQIRDRAQRLTERERQVMDLVVQGLSNAETADVLSISVRTVENHRARVMEKMKALSLSELVRASLRLNAA